MKVLAILILGLLLAPYMWAAPAPAPAPVPANTPPTIQVTANTISGGSSVGGGNTIGNGSTVYVAYGTTVANFNAKITVGDADNDPCSLSANITNLGSTGILASEWGSASQAVSYTVNPGSGTFNTQGGASHVVTLTADDGQDTTVFSFTIQQTAGSNGAPVIQVGQMQGATAVMVSNGGTLNVSYGDSVQSLGLTLFVSDPDNDSVSLSASITNLGSTGMVLSEWESASAQTPYSASPSSGTFNTPNGTTHTIDLSVDDGTAQGSFTFYIQQAAQPAQAAIEVSENSSTIAYNASATGTNRDFGSLDVGTGPTSALTITISNTGNADLNLSGFTVTGASGEFVLDTNNTASVVSPAGSTDFSISFDPQSAGSHSAWVEFVHNDPNVTSPFRFEVVGIGTTPAPVPLLVVREGGSTGGVLTNNAAAGGMRDFGSLDLSQLPSSPVTIYVENAGNADLNLGTPASVNGDFTVQASSFPSVLSAGTSATFQVTFTATTTGGKNGSVSFTHNDGATATPFVVNLTGTATSSSGGGSGGSSVGGGSSAGGGCVATEGHTWLWALGMLGLIGLVYRRRRTA